MQNPHAGQSSQETILTYATRVLKRLKMILSTSKEQGEIQMGRRNRKKNQRNAAAKLENNEMPKVKCKGCGKEWGNIQGYMADKGCPNQGCPHVPRQSKSGETVVFRREAAVKSDYDDSKQALFLDVPKVIAIEMFPPGCKAKKPKVNG